MKRFAWFALSLSVLVIGCSSASDSGSTPPDTGGKTAPTGDTGKTSDAGSATSTFASMAQPVLAKCQQCHSGPNPKEGIDMSTYAGLMKGGEDGPVVVAGDPDNSVLIMAMKGTGGKKQMPPTGKLPDEEIAKVADWIKAGAKE